MVNTAAICMYMHRVNTAATICMYRHGTYPGLPRGECPTHSLYSLHMLTTLGRGLLGQDKGILGQLGLGHCYLVRLCVVSASYLLVSSVPSYHMNFFAYLAMSCDSALIVPRVKHFSALHLV